MDLRETYFNNCIKNYDATGANIIVNRHSGASEIATGDEASVLAEWKNQTIGSTNSINYFGRKVRKNGITSALCFGGAAAYMASATGAIVFSAGPIVAGLGLCALGAYLASRAVKNNKKRNILRRDKLFADNETQINNAIAAHTTNKKLYGQDRNGNEIELTGRGRLTLNDISTTTYGDLSSFVKSVDGGTTKGLVQKAKDRANQLVRRVRRMF